MKPLRRVLGWEGALAQSIVLYVALAIVFLPRYQYQVNPDGISYISIAQKYLLHSYRDAINAYWGPLLSWLLVPFMIVGTAPLFAAKLLSLVIGAVTIVQSDALITIVDVRGASRAASLYMVAIVALYCALTVITPDLLFVCLALGYFNTVLPASYRERKHTGVLCGVLGAGLYLAKSYGFIFFLAHFTLISVLFYFGTDDGRDRRRVARHWLSGIAIFTLIAACWVSILTAKYGHVTIGTAGRYNHAVMAPHSPGHPMHYAGLFDPPNATATSVWEDVSSLNVRDWSAFDSRRSFAHQLTITGKNILRIGSFLNGFSYLFLPLLLAAIVCLVREGRRSVSDNLLYLVLSVLVACAGYAVVLVESRYLWLCDILIIVIGAKLLDSWFARGAVARAWRFALIAVFVASFIAMPLGELYRGRDDGKKVHDLSETVRRFNIHGRVASNRNWAWSLYLSFYNGWQYYGERGILGEPELRAELERKKIDYYLVWRALDSGPDSFRPGRDVTNGTVKELGIYELR